MNTHIPPERFLEYVDGGLGNEDRKNIEDHLSSCGSCRTAFSDFQYLDRTLHEFPLRETSRGFSGRVMASVLSKGKEPFTFRMLTGLAYAFAMLIVLVVLGGVFVVTGVIGVESGSEGGNRIQSVLDATSSTLATTLTLVTTWVREYLPFFFGSGSVVITGTIFGVVLGLFLFDRMVGWKIEGRLKASP